MEEASGSGLARVAAVAAAALFLLATWPAIGQEVEITERPATPAAAKASAPPRALTLEKAPGKAPDLRKLPKRKPKKGGRPERDAPEIEREILGAPGEVTSMRTWPVPPQAAPAPVPSLTFAGLDLATWGMGYPPDPNGDVGPDHYVQAINTSIGIYDKDTGAELTAISFDDFMSAGAFGNLCDTDNFGDPIVLYDSFEDRWVISDFAFQLDGSINVVNPPGVFECIAVSQTGDPVAGGWNFYSINTAGAFGDYPKLGIWPDGIYMSVNMFGYAAGSSYVLPRVYAFNKKQMYAGEPSVQVVSFDAPSADFTLLPANARLQTGTPPAGAPNYFVSTWRYLNALTVYKFHVDWERIGLSTFTGPDMPQAGTSWPNAAVGNAPTPANSLDTLQIRAMMQNQYTNLGGTESLWTAHTVRRADTTGFAAPRWYQVDVTGGTVAANLPQAATWDPDGANLMYRYMPSLALDRGGNLALGYTTSNATTNPGIRYAGRLAGDPVNTFSQTEQTMFDGTGSQSGNCGGSPCARWGDYSAMSLDPDGCTFWYTNEYYATTGLSYLTRIGRFAYPECTPVGAGGTLQGTVTATVGGTPIAGATVTFGSRTTTTLPGGTYQFTGIPAGTYGSVVASSAGFDPGSATPVAITDGGTTIEDFALAAGPASACPQDTTQADFQTGVTDLDLDSSPGNAVLSGDGELDQFNNSFGTSGSGITLVNWLGQVFTPAVSGQLARAELRLFCSGCTGTTPNLTLSLRATSGGLPTGPDLATATIPGFSSGSSVFYSAVFASPATVTAGTQYALVIRPTALPSAGIYAFIRSGSSTAGANVYAGGTRVLSTDSGVNWSTPLTAGVSTDAGFRTYVAAPSGELVSLIKDANPAAGSTANWNTISWNATTSASTTVQLQAAASNDPAGPFDFVGPDGTAVTFFTNGGSLAQFNGFRYLKYRAVLGTADPAETPILNDVEVCFTNVPIVPVELQKVVTE